MISDHFSFQIKNEFTVTCLHIEQYVVNSRAILCLGSANGDIAIYYLDEPVNQRTQSSKSARPSTIMGEIKYK